MSKRKLTAAERAQKRQRKAEFQIIFVHGKMKRVRRPHLIDGMEATDFILQHADPVWLHQNEMWEHIDAQLQSERDLGSSMSRLTKVQRRHLRQLLDIAYDRELGAALQDLHAHFLGWQTGAITALDLNDRIHAYHHGISRDLYKRYSAALPEAVVARAISLKVLQWDEVNADIRPLFAGLVDYFSAGDEA